MIGHLLVVPEREYSRREDGERWCFRCRSRCPFVLRVLTPVDEMSYYGPRAQVECDRGHVDGDCFPGTWREGAA